MKVLVTGGSGFLGQHVMQRLLDAGHEATNLDVNRPGRFPDRHIQGDIRDEGACIAAVRGKDAIVHLAALYRDDVRPRQLYFDVNVTGTRNVAQAAGGAGVRHVVFASSFSVYGLDDAGKSEEGALAPVNDYGRSKAEAESLLREWQSAGDGRLLQMVRPCVIFGEGSRGNVWTLLQQIASGRFVMVGAGSNKKSMAYVGNVAAFLEFLLVRAGQQAHAGQQVEVYNYADKPDMAVRDIVGLAAKTLEKRIINVPLPGRLAMIAGYAGDLFGRATGRASVITSERVRKFLADTSLPVDRAIAAGFVPPFGLRDSYVRTIKHEFGV